MEKEFSKEELNMFVARKTLEFIDEAEKKGFPYYAISSASFSMALEISALSSLREQGIEMNDETHKVAIGIAKKIAILKAERYKIEQDYDIYKSVIDDMFGKTEEEMSTKKYRLQYRFLQEATERQRREIMQSFGFEYDESKQEIYNSKKFIEYIDKENKWDELAGKLPKQH